MCATCDKAKDLPVPEALRLIGSAMKRRGAGKCLDELVGKLIGVEMKPGDPEAEAMYERRRAR